MTYSNDFVDLFRRLAVTVADVLKGKRPQDIPIGHQPQDGQVAGDRRAAHAARPR